MWLKTDSTIGQLAGAAQTKQIYDKSANAEILKFELVPKYKKIKLV